MTARAALSLALLPLACIPNVAAAAPSSTASSTIVLTENEGIFARLLDAMLPEDDPTLIRDGAVRAVIAGLVQDNELVADLARSKPAFLPDLTAALSPRIEAMLMRQNADMRRAEIGVLQAGLSSAEASEASAFYASAAGRKLVSVNTGPQAGTLSGLSADEVRSLAAFASTAVGAKLAVVLHRLVAVRQKALQDGPSEAEMEGLRTALIAVVARHRDPPGTVSA